MLEITQKIQLVFCETPGKLIEMLSLETRQAGSRGA